ncbi:fungal chitosanase of glycosyl hydrolase group 75-domain-containing protein [Mycena filopes]|nr:fungal chitosanase of glycosyl hydrolase group 75-domain-containing protein [Mycena filopes]
MRTFFSSTICASLFISSFVHGAPLPAKKTATTTSTTHKSGSTVPFAADPSINVAAIYAAVQKATANPAPSGSFPTTTDDGGKQVQIYGDFPLLGGSSGMNKSGAAATSKTAPSTFHFIADMDTDCDGTDENCTGNPDGQSETSFGALSAAAVPYFVLPLSFTENKENKAVLRDNALGAIICDGKMFYGIYGDQDGDKPEEIGEASILMGRTCFPDTTIDGAHGHSEVDVAYIVFGEQVPDGVPSEGSKESKIDLAALKKLGDEQMTLLQSALGITPL